MLHCALWLWSNNITDRCACVQIAFSPQQRDGLNIHGNTARIAKRELQSPRRRAVSVDGLVPQSSEKQGRVVMRQRPRQRRVQHRGRQLRQSPRSLRRAAVAPLQDLIRPRRSPAGPGMICLSPEQQPEGHRQTQAHQHSHLTSGTCCALSEKHLDAFLLASPRPLERAPSSSFQEPLPPQKPWQKRQSNRRRWFQTVEQGANGAGDPQKVTPCPEWAPG